MITAGIDSGNKNTRTVLLKDGVVAARVRVATEFDAAKAAALAYEEALSMAGISQSMVSSVIATGAGRNRIGFADETISEISAAALGTRFVLPNICIVIDVGAEACRVIKLKPEGKVEGYEVNDKCASGVGTFLDTMALVLQLPMEKLGPVSLAHSKSIPMNSQCVVFAESEVISLIHRQEDIADIAYSIHNSVACRIGSLVRKVGLVDGLAMIGGPANNAGLVHCMENNLGKAITVPTECDCINALGAAVYALKAPREKEARP